MRTAGAARASRREPTKGVATGLLFRAFSDITRLRILHLLQGHEVCVGDLVKILRVPQARASRHLTYLRRARLVVTRKSGLWVYYSLAESNGRLHERLLECLRACREELPRLVDDARRHDALRKAGGCCPR
jgi:ArsR family transcriptional regulator, arsenate/arsenite/antimonite-responsive transcriptional repressor